MPPSPSARGALVVAVLFGCGRSGPGGAAREAAPRMDASCDCRPGETRPCLAACGSAGTQTCEAACRWPSACAPPAETCNGADDDCDVVRDSGCPCVVGDRRPCGTDRGECVAGAQTCTPAGWDACTGALGPTEEVCDGLDNDCDSVDDIVEEDLCPDAPPADECVGPDTLRRYRPPGRVRRRRVLL